MVLVTVTDSNLIHDLCFLASILALNKVANFYNKTHSLCNSCHSLGYL